ncbi:MAG: hypothetical protein HPY45_03225 [Anaerolineae bacterium]|nr:hypothetical protein [Anaerolineae bacterium]
MKAALFPGKYAFIINRYFHIYMMMPFFKMAGGALQGVKVFWGFVVCLTVVLVYVNARLLSRSVPVGLLAVVLFASQSLIFFYPGVVWTDYTVMLLSAIALLIYLLLPLSARYRKLMLIGLGMLFYFLYRTKETGFPLLILLVGLGFLSGEKFDWKSALYSAVWVFAGGAAGIVLMMLADQAVLGDALFAWRLETIRENLRFNITSQVDKNFAFNYYQIFADRLDVFTVGLFYLVSFFTVGKTQSNFIKVVWLFPLATIVFLVLTLLRGPGVIVDRYLIPILPYYCVLAAQNFRLEEEYSKKKYLAAVGVVISALALVYVSRILVVRVSLRYGIDKWDEVSYFSAFVYPIVFSVWVGLLLFFRRQNVLVWAISLSVVLMMSYPPLLTNWERLTTRWAAENSMRRFYPLAVYQNQISYSSDMKMFVSNSLPQYDPSKPDYGMLDGDAANVSTLFSLFFGQMSSPEQFIRGEPEAYVDQYDQVDYAFLTPEDWRYLPPEVSARIEGMYDVQTDPQGVVVFVRRK